MATPTTHGEILDMNDDDFATLGSAPKGAEPEVVEDKPLEEKSAEEIKAEEPAKTEEPAKDDSKSVEDDKSSEKQEEANPLGSSDEDIEKAKTPPVKKEEEPKVDPEIKPKDKKEEKPSEEKKSEEDTPPNYEALYQEIMKPFKANGKTIELRDPKEAIALMQMGANYTKKLQDLQPHRKLLLMLQNNNLLDEGKLSFLIDIDKKDPSAIKKLVKDSGIDPLEIDVNEDPAYQEGSHKVDDSEVVFRTTLDELSSNPEGAVTLQKINTDWDQASKEELWSDPSIMTAIHTQREVGIYDLITEEMDRQKLLGKIPTNTPFLKAYKTVGDQLMASGGFEKLEQEQAKDIPKPEAEVKKDPVILDTKADIPKPALANGDKADAAASTKGAPGKAKETVNFLSMSDEEFLKTEKFQGRL